MKGNSWAWSSKRAKCSAVFPSPCSFAQILQPLGERQQIDPDRLLFHRLGDVRRMLPTWFIVIRKNDHPLARQGLHISGRHLPAPIEVVVAAQPSGRPMQ